MLPLIVFTISKLLVYMVPLLYVIVHSHLLLFLFDHHLRIPEVDTNGLLVLYRDFLDDLTDELIGELRVSCLCESFVCY